MIKTGLRILSAGDFHLYHPRTPTAHVIANLDRHVFPPARLATTDLVVIPGDVFDRLLSYDNRELDQIQAWITRFLYRCAEHDVLVRIVEGTPSHDWKQSRFFTEQAANANIPVDVHYAATLSIEYIERYDCHVLYVPDKWRPDPNDTLAEVRSLLASRNLDQVDFAVMHGAFEYQLPSIVKEPTHDSAAYLSLVAYYIFIGHVHTPTRHERILAAGSVDRLAQNEEEPKGFYEVIVRPTGDDTVIFHTNPHAKIYRSLNCHGQPMGVVEQWVEQQYRELPSGSEVLLRAQGGDPVLVAVDDLRRRYPQIHWRAKDDGSAAATTTDIDTLLEEEVEALPPLDHETLLAQVGERLSAECHDKTTVTRCQKRLEELCHELNNG